MEFIAAAEKPAGCIFCVFPAEDRDRENLILHRGARAFVMLNKFPYNNGHLMIVPRAHAASLSALGAEDRAELDALLSRAVDVLGKAYAPEGFNVGMNLGKVAGAGIADHLHWHVVPRWNGDTNFMPVLAETKVMIEHLHASYDRLKPLF
jgi:ATP adenylyltransferase